MLIWAEECAQGQDDGFKKLSASTSDLIPADMKRLNPSDPDNMKLQAKADTMYWGENINRIQDLWLDAIS